MIGAFGVFADEVIQLIICLRLRTGLDFVAHEGFEGILSKDFARQADALAEIDPVAFLAHVVEADHGIISRIRAPQADRAARLGSHGSDMGLKAMTLRGCLPVIAHGDRQEVELHIRIIYARA